jgi:hypothetical protein
MARRKSFRSEPSRCPFMPHPSYGRVCKSLRRDPPGVLVEQEKKLQKQFERLTRLIERKSSSSCSRLNDVVANSVTNDFTSRVTIQTFHYVGAMRLGGFDAEP